MKKILVWVGVILIVTLGGVFAYKKMTGGQQAANTTVSSSANTATTTASYDTKASKSLTNGHCSGTGSVPIIPPMKLDQVNSIQPYGLMVGGHVTPIDHQYYIGTDPKALRDTYDVVAPADGKIVDIEHRGNKFNTPPHSVDVPSSDEYRFVFMHTCSFLTYVDLVTSLDDSIKAELPANWSPQNPEQGLPIPVKQGQVIGHIGGQTLDFAVWDLSQKPLGFLVRKAYDNAEQWKVFTAPPSQFFTADSKAAAIAKYVRTVEPIDGKIDYDQEGKLIGTWFRVGSNGYDGGRATDRTKQDYWAGHLAIAPNYIDPSKFVVSLGEFKSSGINGNPNDPGGSGDSGAQQFGIKGNAPDPATIDSTSGLIKYELVTQVINKPDGSRWQGELASGIKVVNGTQVQGVLLLQMLAPHSLKVEVFPGKTAAEVTAFDDKAMLYNRGDDATLPGTAANGQTSTAH